MSDERFDLSALEVQEDARFERMVQNITTRAQFELKRRATSRRPSVFELVAGWARPALAAAASIAVISVTLLSVFEPTAAVASGGAYMSPSVPAAASTWYEENRDPTAADLLVALEQGEDR